MVYTTYQNCDLGDGVWHFVIPHYQSPKIGRSGVPLGPISSTKLPCTGFLPCERLVSSIPGTRHLGSEICNAYHVDVLQNQYASNLQMQKCKTQPTRGTQVANPALANAAREFFAGAVAQEETRIALRTFLRLFHHYLGLRHIFLSFVFCIS